MAETAYESYPVLLLLPLPALRRGSVFLSAQPCQNDVLALCGFGHSSKQLSETSEAYFKCQQCQLWYVTINLISTLTIMLALFLGASTGITVSVMGTEVIAQHGRVLDSPPCFLFPVLPVADIPVSSPLSFLVQIWLSFVLSCLFLSVCPVTPSHFPPTSEHKHVRTQVFL